MQILTTNVEDTTAATLVSAEPVAADAAPSALDNALTIGIAAAMALAVIVMVIRKALSGKKAAAVPAEVVEEVPEAPKPTAPGAAGEVKLNNVEPKTAAMLMAIVADKMGKPINELRFISIKEVE